MRNTFLLPAATILALYAAFPSVAQASTPDLHELKLVTQLPPELPQRIMGLAYDGEKLWATIYLGRGRHAKLNPSTLDWEPDTPIKHNQAVARVAGAFGSPGGLCFANGRLWIIGAYGQSFGSINTGSWQIEQHFKVKQREDVAGQSYSSVAYDGNYLWIVWHWFRYDLPTSETQQLLKVDPQDGRVVAVFAAPAGTRNDAAHGLSWDGTSLWHMKDKNLSSIDPSTGAITAQYVIRNISRPSGLAWVQNALWIAEFDGKIWRLPFSP